MTTRIGEVLGLGGELEAMTSERWQELKAEHDRHAAAERDRAEREAAEARMCARRRDLEAWGVPGKDRELVTSGQVHATAAARRVRAFMADLLSGSGKRTRPLLALSGAPGCGKTTAAALVLMEHAQRWRSAAQPPMFVTAARLVRWNRFDDAAMQALERASALVLDDLGAEYIDNKGAFVALVDGIVNARYADWQPTIITTNLDHLEFTARYGERTIDRLREAGEFFEIADGSLRGRNP